MSGRLPCTQCPHTRACTHTHAHMQSTLPAHLPTPLQRLVHQRLRAPEAQWQHTPGYLAARNTPLRPQAPAGEDQGQDPTLTLTPASPCTLTSNTVTSYIPQLNELPANVRGKAQQETLQPAAFDPGSLCANKQPLLRGRVQERLAYLRRVRERGDVVDMMFAVRADLLRNLGNMTNRWVGAREWGVGGAGEHQL